MKKQNDEDITLAPRFRNKLMDDEYKLGKIDFTKEELVTLTKFIGTPAWDIIKNIYLKQRAVQIATHSINFAKTVEDIHFYRGLAAENKYVTDDLERIVNDFKKEDEKKSDKAAPKTTGNTPVTGARELISKVK